MDTRRCARLCALPAAAALSSYSCAVFGSGFALLEQSASRLGTAFAGTAAAADDASTIFYNPAGLSRLEQGQVLVVLSGVNISSKFRNVDSQAALGQLLGAEGGDAGDWNAVPSGYVALPINEQLAVGFGFNVPFGLKLDYDNGWIGRFQALKSEIETFNFSPSLSWRLSERVTLGLGVNYQRLQAELTNAVNYTAVIGQVAPALVPANPGLTGSAVVRGDDGTWGFNAGVLIELSPQARLGLSYRSAIDYDIEGSARFSAPAATDPTVAAIIAGVSAPGAELASGRAAVDLKLPDIATASFYRSLGRIEVLADIAWTGWSSVQELRIVREHGQPLVTPERWKDTWRFALGATYELNDTWKLRAGLAYDETPVPAATRTARLPDAERRWVAIGAQWKPDPSIVVDVGYAHLFSDDVRLHQDEGNVLASGFLGGQQESSVDIVSAQVAWRFGS